MRTKEEIEENPKLKKIKHLIGETYSCDIHISGWVGSCIFGFNEGGKEHISVSPYDKRITPSWNDMCKAKDIFWGDEEECYQVFPKKSEYVNIQKNCLHIWKDKE